MKPQQPSSRSPRPITKKARSRMIHDITPTQWLPRRVDVPPSRVERKSSASAQPSAARQQRPRKSHSGARKGWLKKYGFIVATLIVLIVIVRLSASPDISRLVVAAYAIGVFLLRISSRVTFGLAAVALVGVGIELAMLPEPGRANNGALLVFLFLGIGLISHVFETRRLEPKIKVSRRR